MEGRRKEQGIVDRREKTKQRGQQEEVTSRAKKH